MEQHVKAVAALNIFLGAVGVLGGVMGFVVFGGIASIVQVAAGQDADAQVASGTLGLIALLLLGMLTVMSLPALATGFGLLGRHRWARIVGIAVSVLHLFNPPVGTFVGAYGLWVLLVPASDPVFSDRPASG